MGVRPGDVAHVTLSYHIMPGGLRLHRAFEEAGCLVHQRRDGQQPLAGGGGRAPGGATVYAGTPSFLANLGDTARELGLDPRRDLALPRRLLDRRGADAAAAPRSPGDLRHRALRPLRRGADRSARRRVPRARRHAPPRARPLLRVPRSRDAASRWRRAGTGELVATQLGPRALPLVRYAPGDVFRLLAGRVRVRRPGAARRLRRTGRRHPEDQGRARASGAGPPRAVASSRRVGRFQIVVDHPAGRTLRPRRAARRVSPRRPDDAAALARAIAERVKAVVLIGMDVELVARGRAAGGRRARRASPTAWSIDGAPRDRAAAGGSPLLRSGHPDDAARARARAAGRAPGATARPRLGDAGAVLPPEARGGRSPARRPARARRPRRHPDDGEGRAARRARRSTRPSATIAARRSSAAVRLGASTGTSGRPTLILWTRKDLEVDHAASARGRWRWGLRPGMSLANAHPVRHERRRLALQPRRRGARRAQHPVGAARRRGARRAT